MSTHDRVRDFLRTHTALGSAALCPEILLHLSTDFQSVWDCLEASSLSHRGTPPFWCVPWIGGQALARYTLDNAEKFRGCSILDLGSGSGLCAIAAAMAGPRCVEASDIDPVAREVISLNASINHVTLAITSDVVSDDASRWDVILAADLWYERFASQRLTGWLQSRAGEGARVFLGDCGRAHFPRNATRELGSYLVRPSNGLERSDAIDVRVWTFR